MSKLILTSYGLTSKVGRELISKELKKDENLENKKIFLFHEPYFSIADILVDVCAEIGFRRENIFIVCYSYGGTYENTGRNAKCKKIQKKDF